MKIDEDQKTVQTSLTKKAAKVAESNTHTDANKQRQPSPSQIS